MLEAVSAVKLESWHDVSLKTPSPGTKTFWVLAISLDSSHPVSTSTIDRLFSNEEYLRIVIPQPYTSMTQDMTHDQ